LCVVRACRVAGRPIWLAFLPAGVILAPPLPPTPPPRTAPPRVCRAARWPSLSCPALPALGPGPAWPGIGGSSVFISGKVGGRRGEPLVCNMLGFANRTDARTRARTRTRTRGVRHPAPTGQPRTHTCSPLCCPCRNMPWTRTSILDRVRASYTVPRLQETGREVRWERTCPKEIRTPRDVCPFNAFGWGRRGCTFLPGPQAMDTSCPYHPATRLSVSRWEFPRMVAQGEWFSTWTTPMYQANLRRYDVCCIRLVPRPFLFGPGPMPEAIEWSISWRDASNWYAIPTDRVH
jgi:hypothetical protein